MKSPSEINHPRSLAPHPNLSSWIDSYWFFSFDHLQKLQDPANFYPIGYPFLEISFSENGEFVSTPPTLPIQMKNIFMSLTDRFITVHPPVHAKLVLIRFNPSILAIIGPGSFSTNLIVKPADIFGTSFKHLCEQLYPAQKVMKQKKLLDQFFLKYIQDKEQRTDHRITFGRSTESTRYVRRAVAALYQDELRLKKTGRSWSVGRLAKEYDFKDKDGTQPEAFVLPEA